MNNEADRNYISVGQWMALLLLTAIPVVGWVLIFVLAFAGDNQSRKNYFRAIIGWLLVVVALFATLGLIGFWPEIQKHFQGLIHPAR